MSAPTKTNRHANLIRGYVANIDEYPRPLRHASPTRLAVAFNCYDPSAEGNYFLDHALIAEMCRKIIGASDCQIWDDKHRPIDLKNLEQAIDNLASITVGEGGQATLCNICRWDRIGGPPEYHDRYTIEVFTTENNAKILWQRMVDALAVQHCAVEIFERHPTPQPIGGGILSVLRQIRNMFWRTN